MGSQPCVVVRPQDRTRTATAVDYFVGVCAETAGSRALCLQLAEFPPGTRARAHLHDEHESAAYVLRGEVEMWWGEGLREHVVVRAGEFCFIPAGVPHLPLNNGSETAVAVLARSDPNLDESVVLLPELDSLPHLGRKD